MIYKKKILPFHLKPFFGPCLLPPAPSLLLLLFDFQRLTALQHRVWSDRNPVFDVKVVLIVHLVGDVGAFLSGQTPQQQKHQDADQHQQNQAHNSCKVGDKKPTVTRYNSKITKKNLVQYTEKNKSYLSIKALSRVILHSDISLKITEIKWRIYSIITISE